jgi:hypothetical protein
MKKISIILIGLIGLVGHAFSSDFVLLNNNLFFEGKILRSSNEVIVFKTSAGVFDIPKSDVCEIYLESQLDELTNLSSGDDQALCLKAQTDASSYHGKKVGHFCLGFFFGGFALIGTAFSNPTPYKGKQTMLQSKNKESFDDPVYLNCYKKTAKRELLLAETAGWVSWILLFTLLNS